jgi:hypothetical protein
MFCPRAGPPLTNPEAVRPIACRVATAFSSRGDRVAFTSMQDGDYEICILELDAEGSPGRDMHPRFSPERQVAADHVAA